MTWGDWPLVFLGCVWFVVALCNWWDWRQAQSQESSPDDG